jgi:acyl carrier protein
MTLSLSDPEVLPAAHFETFEQESCAPAVKTALKSVILAKFAEVAGAQGKALATLSDDLVLLESGLDSLCFAIIVASLEDELGFDPFTEAEDVFFPVTLADFVLFYERSR